MEWLSDPQIWISLLTLTGLASSKGEARRTVAEGGVYVNNVRVGALHVSCSDEIGPGTTDESQLPAVSTVSRFTHSFCHIVSCWSSNRAGARPRPPSAGGDRHGSDALRRELGREGAR